MDARTRPPRIAVGTWDHPRPRDVVATVRINNFHKCCEQQCKERENTRSNDDETKDDVISGGEGVMKQSSQCYCLMEGVVLLMSQAINKVELVKGTMNE